MDRKPFTLQVVGIQSLLNLQLLESHKFIKEVDYPYTSSNFNFLQNFYPSYHSGPFFYQCLLSAIIYQNNQQALSIPLNITIIDPNTFFSWVYVKILSESVPTNYFVLQYFLMNLNISLNTNLVYILLLVSNTIKITSLISALRKKVSNLQCINN